MTQRRIPIDVVKVDEARLDETAYKQGFGAHDEMKRRVLERPAARSRYEEALAEIRNHQITLAEVRRARSMTQATVANLMDMTQSEVSKFERRCDMYLSTMKRFVEATGGELHLVASYPDGDSVELLIGDADPATEPTAQDLTVPI